MPRARRVEKSGLVLFECPGCGCCHYARVESAGGCGPLWTWNGDFDRPTINPSIFVNRPGSLHNPESPSCHSFVRDGKIQFLSDCTHAMAGQTVDLPEI